MTEGDDKIVEYLANKVGTSIDKAEENAKEMLKYITSTFTVLTVLATFFKVECKYIIIPIIFLVLGILGFLKVIKPDEFKYTVGERDSSVKAYNEMVKYKSKWLKVGYYCSYIALLYFAFVIVA